MKILLRKSDNRPIGKIIVDNNKQRMKFEIRKNLTLCIAVFFFFASAKAQQVNSFSVQQAVAYAKQNSIPVRNALVDLQIQKQTNKEVTARALPNLSGSGTFNYFPNVGVQSFPNFIAAGTYGVLSKEGVKDGNGNTIVSPSDFGIIQAQFGTKYSLAAGVDFSQLLFDGQVFIGLQARKATLDFAGKQVEVTEEMIDENVQKIYYQLVVARQQITTVDANISRFEKLLSDTREIYKQGFAEKLDIDKVSVQLSNLQTEKIKLQNTIDAGNAGLKFLMHMPQKDSLVLTDSITPAMVEAEVMDNSYNYADRKEYQLAQIGKKLNEYNVRRYKLSKLPTLASFANFTKNAQRNEFDFFGNKPYFSSSVIGVKLTVPIFEGFAKNARIERARLELQKTNNNIEQLEYSIDNDVKQSTINMASALAAIKFQEKNMKLAEEVYTTTKYKYEQGLGSNQEIYTAQTELKTAQNNYYSSLYDAVIAKVNYLKATGKLTP